VLAGRLTALLLGSDVPGDALLGLDVPGDALLGLGVLAAVLQVGPLSWDDGPGPAVEAELATETPLEEADRLATRQSPSTQRWVLGQSSSSRQTSPSPVATQDETRSRAREVRGAYGFMSEPRVQAWVEP
jgi:hypothetical protein